jgi:hypothetical protein
MLNNENPQVAELTSEFCADDIYNVDEASLFYRTILESTLSYEHTTLLSGSKKAMHCLTGWCCLNTPGIDNQKLLDIGKGLSFGALRGLVWTVYHSYSIQTNIRRLHVKF